MATPNWGSAVPGGVADRLGATPSGGQADASDPSDQSDMSDTIAAGPPARLLATTFQIKGAHQVAERRV